MPTLAELKAARRVLLYRQSKAARVNPCWLPITKDALRLIDAAIGCFSNPGTKPS
jgi:hypothetical protein